MAERTLFLRRAAAGVLAAVMVLLLFPGVSLGSELIGSEEELLAMLSLYRAHGTADFDMALTGGFFGRISEDNFREFRVIALKAGLADYSLKYSSQGGLYFEGAQWTEPHTAEAATEQEFRRAFQQFLEEGAGEFQVIVRDQRLFESLQRRECAFAYAALYGADSLRVRTTDASPYVFYLDEIQVFTRPWYAVSSRDDWIRGVDSMAARGAAGFVLVLDPLFAEKLQKDEDLIRQMEARSSMASWHVSYRTDYTRFEFSDVEYATEPRIECETEEMVVEAIRQMGASGITAFRLILPGELYERVSADDFARLRALEADAGMSDRELSYSEGLGTLAYAQAEIRPGAVKLATPEEAAAHLKQAVADGEESIALFCTPELYSMLTGNPEADTGGLGHMSLLGDELAHAGIFRYTYSCSKASAMIRITVTALYPGTKILRAVEKGTEDALSPREKETLAAARQLALACADDDPLTAARKIHDALCERVEYHTDENTDEDDTATGALLNGQADCDGYADAFFLTGSLAGLEVRCQHGDSKRKDPDERYRDVTHLWNLIRIDGTWRMVDVTWDDQESGIEYTWFNIGADRARRMHVWNEETSVPLLEETVMAERPGYEFSVSSLAGADGALLLAAMYRYSPFTLVFPADTDVTGEQVLQAVRKALKTSFTYQWNEYMKTMWVSYD